MTPLTLTFALAALFAGDGEGDEKKKKGKSAQQISIEIHVDSPIRGTRVLIRDVAKVKTADPALTDRILQMELGRPPHPGYTRTVTRNDILLRVMREGFPPSRVKFVGPSQTFLQPVTHRLTPAELAKAATGVLERAILDDEYPDITHTLRSRLSTHRIQAGRESRELKARLRYGKLGTNHAQVDVQVLVDGELVDTISLNFGLTRFYRVLAAAWSIRPGTEVTQANVTWKRVEARFGVAQHLTNLDQLRGQMARRLIRRGDVLTLSHLTVRSIIRGGDVVSLVVGGGAIKVTTRVRAVDGGSYGQFIRVQRLNTISRDRRVAANALLVAKIVSPNKVVMFTEGSPARVGPTSRAHK